MNGFIVRRPPAAAAINPNSTGSWISSARTTCLWCGNSTGFSGRYAMVLTIIERLAADKADFAAKQFCARLPSKQHIYHMSSAARATRAGFEPKGRHYSPSRDIRRQEPASLSSIAGVSAPSTSLTERSERWRRNILATLKQSHSQASPHAIAPRTSVR